MAASGAIATLTVSDNGYVTCKYGFNMDLTRTDVVSEPATLSLPALSGLAAIRRRRK